MNSSLEKKERAKEVREKYVYKVVQPGTARFKETQTPRHSWNWGSYLIKIKFPEFSSSFDSN